jgi:uncharacterized protein YbjT (DUF2867 family)
MFLVMGITGKVGGAAAKHLLAHGKEVRALVRNREKAANWANRGVELVGGDWNDSAAIEEALNGVEGVFVMLPSNWAPSPDFKEAKGVIANYVAALTKAAPPRVVALSSMGADRTSGIGMITALSFLEQRFRELIPTAEKSDSWGDSLGSGRCDSVVLIKMYDWSGHDSGDCGH